MQFKKRASATRMAEILKDLRLSKGLTQEQLARETGLSLSSIKHYELGNREPNSKAMVILENYYHVSGEFLRGDLDKTTFYNNCDRIGGDLDDIYELVLLIRSKMSTFPQQKLLKLTQMIKSFLLFSKDSIVDSDSFERFDIGNFEKVFSYYVLLNDLGQEEILKRIEELSQLKKYSS